MITNAFPATTPCNYTFLYPPAISSDAIQKNQHAVTMIYSPLSNKAYIAITKEKGIGFTFPVSGDPITIALKFGKIPWEEVEIQNDNGIFTYKKAPSYNEMVAYFSDSTT
ncbi:hypothetical protein [Bacillus safensis]|uniref:hypothetical protein n=1 Tax=Bacillus safensis TaxID=561879 RepID=UPI002E1C13AE|nr:hypothetical protein [Bacillus safensis]